MHREVAFTGRTGCNKEIRRLEKIASHFSALSNPIRLGILVALYGGELLVEPDQAPGAPCSLRFSALKDILGIASGSSLSYQLGVLLDAGLIEKTVAQHENGTIYPIYRTSSVGKRVLEDLDAREVIRRHFKSLGVQSLDK